jgi:hypothetical protein
MSNEIFETLKNFKFTVFIMYMCFGKPNNMNTL